MDKVLHELYNTETERVTAKQLMTPLEAQERNTSLRELREPERWIVFF